MKFLNSFLRHLEIESKEQQRKHKPNQMKIFFTRENLDPVIKD